MAKYGSKDVAFLLVNGLSILGDTTSLGDEKEAILEDVTPLGVEWPEFEDAHLRRFTLEQGGLFNDAAGRSNEALAALTGLPVVLCFGIETNAKSKRLKAFEGALQTKYNRTAAKGVLHKASASYVGAGEYEEGLIVLEHSAQTGATGNTEATYVDLGSPSDLGGSAFLQLTALSLGGYTNVIFKIRDSADHISWTDLATFSAKTAVGAERVVIAAGASSVLRYLSVSWAFTGAGAGPTFSAMLGFHVNR